MGRLLLSAYAQVPEKRDQVDATVPAGTVLGVGTHVLQVTFNPTNTGLYILNTTTVTLVVNPNPAAPPAFTPGPGSYASAQKVTVADATPGAVIHHTTNGTTPTAASTRYRGTIPVSSTEHIQAIAIAPVYTPSAVAPAAYKIRRSQRRDGERIPASVRSGTFQSGSRTFIPCACGGLETRIRGWRWENRLAVS
jgi:hypothetical protein